MKQRVGGAVKAKAANCKQAEKRQVKSVSKKKRDKQEQQIAELVLNHRENGRKLARSILRRWRVRMPADDIDSIVDLSLCEAARRFSDDHGASFMTFFFYHLRGHLVRAVARAAQASNVFMGWSQHSGIETGDWQRLGNETIWTFMPEYFLFSQRDLSTPEHEILKRERIEQCRSALMQLDDLEKQIISRSFGTEQPLVDIARSLGYSRCHISRVKKAALQRLRKIMGAAEGKEIQDEDEEVFVEDDTPSERNLLLRETSRRRTRRRATESQRPTKAKAA